MKIDQINNITVNRKTLAEILNYKNENTITNLVTLHGAPRLKHNEYPLIEFLTWHRNYKTKLHKESLNRLLHENAKDLLDRYNIELKELDLQKRRNEFIPVKQVKVAWQFEMDLFQSYFIGFSNKIAASLINMNSRSEIVQIIEVEINKIFLAISDDKRMPDYLPDELE